MQPQIIFAKEIYVDKLDIDIDEIVKKCLEIKSLDIGVQKTNVLGWQSKPMIDGFENLIEECISRIQEIISFRYSVDRKVSLLNFWININEKFSGNTPHIHPGCLMSAVFYPNFEPNMGNLIFHRDQSELDCYTNMFKIDTKNAFLSNEFVAKPEKKKLFIFPSWYKHSVEPNMTDNNRISIAMNFKI
jgi:uncharacterized protein (TIGR02466 family)